MKYYFDYNATAPLARSVLERLASGEVDFLNPSSLHYYGRYAQKKYREVSHFLLETFNLASSHQVFFHSGATEAVNTCVYSFSLSHPEAIFVALVTDHNCVKNSLRLLEKNHSVIFLAPSKDGGFPKNDFLNILKTHRGKPIFLNWTWVHNETGVIFPLEELESLKAYGDFYTHIDGAQAIGKILHWHKLPSFFDFISFSGHKFGAMKGVGFSFVKKEMVFNPLIQGGGQQGNYRSGTLPVLGILSLQDALKDEWKQKEMLPLAFKAKEKLENKLLAYLKGRGEIVAINNKQRNNNTIFLVLNDISADRSFPFFDMEKLAIGLGAACSSGAKKESVTLKALGYDKEASNGLRFSFSPHLLKNHSDEYWEVILKTLKKIFND